ncbi:MAG TPA: hypothetical protein PLA43_18880 [Bryobacteraceae bacterium]|nr:hypothetical protein [Bryobacteraceae bacterium]HOL70047.1 hypothetical protein [Bryobacteraceae bacterium]HOQ46193.1 hypothetical protein [Bryobacteraceae bacterium]HPQ14371.1 hypothetical protein [Bryobacteraceae bacterium]HPU74024.1 hypothetical protein [Bryobacteraceae bacterium]
MNLKVYYQKVSELEATLEEPFVVVVSKETPDGGRAGVKTEVTRRVAAELVVQGTARLATAEETKAFRQEQAEASRAAAQAAAAKRMQITVISEAELRALKGVRQKA